MKKKILISLSVVALIVLNVFSISSHALRTHKYEEFPSYLCYETFGYCMISSFNVINFACENRVTSTRCTRATPCNICTKWNQVDPELDWPDWWSARVGLEVQSGD